MKIRHLLITLLMFCVAAAAYANYSVSTVDGNVKVFRAGKELKAVKGMKLEASDQLEIAPGAQIAVYNALTKDVYSSTSAGRVSVMDLLMKARAQSSKSNVIGSIGVKRRTPTNTRKYTEGSVKRSMATFDPEGAEIDTDPQQIAAHIAGVINGTWEAPQAPVSIDVVAIGEQGKEFQITNTIDYPLYFNIVKLSRSQVGALELSELGQPTGCYVLLPGQTITRGQLEPMAADSHHILIMTQYQFDVDEVLNAYATICAERNLPDPDPALEVYLKVIK